MKNNTNEYGIIGKTEYDEYFDGKGNLFTICTLYNGDIVLNGINSRRDIHIVQL